MELKKIVYLKSLDEDQADEMDNGQVIAGDIKILPSAYVSYLTEKYPEGTIAEIEMTDEEWELYVEFTISDCRNKIDALFEILTLLDKQYDYELSYPPQLDNMTLEEKVNCVEKYKRYVKAQEAIVQQMLLSRRKIEKK